MPNPEIPSNNQDGNLTKNPEQKETDKLLNQERGKKANEAKIEKDKEEVAARYARLDELDKKLPPASINLLNSVDLNTGVQPESTSETSLENVVETNVTESQTTQEETAKEEKKDDEKERPSYLEVLGNNVRNAWGKTWEKAKNNKAMRTILGVAIGVGITLAAGRIGSEMNKNNNKNVPFDNTPTTSVSDTMFEQSGDEEAKTTTASESYHETINNSYLNRYDDDGLYNDQHKFSPDSVANSERVARFLFNKGKDELTIEEQKEAYYYVISHEAEPLAHFLRQIGMHGFEDLTYDQAVTKLKGLSDEESGKLLDEVKDIIRDAKGEYRIIKAGTVIKNFYMTRGSDGKMHGAYRETELKNDERVFDLTVDHGDGTKSRSTFLLRCYNGGVEMTLILNDGTEQTVEDDLKTPSINIWLKIIEIFKNIDINLNIDNTNTKVIRVVRGGGGHNNPKPQEVVPKTENAHGGGELTDQDHIVSSKDVITEKEEKKIVEENKTNIVAQPGDPGENNEVNTSGNNGNVESTPHFVTTEVVAQGASVEGERLPGGEDQSSAGNDQNNTGDESHVNGEGVNFSQYQTGSENSEKKAKAAAESYFNNTQNQKTSNTGNGNKNGNNQNGNRNGNNNSRNGNGNSNNGNSSKGTTASQSSVNAVREGNF